MSLDSTQLQGIHKASHKCLVTVQGKSHHAAGTSRKILELLLVLGIAFQLGEAYPLDIGAVLQKAGDLHCAEVVALHSHCESLEAKADIEGVLGTLNCAKIPHQLTCSLGDVCEFAEFLGINYSVISRVGSAQSGEFVCVGGPVKIAAVHDCTSYRNSLTVNILCSGMSDNVHSPLERTAIDGCREGIVHNDRDTVVVCNAHKFLQIHHPHSGIGEGLSEKQLGIGSEGRIDLLFGSILIDECHIDAHFLECRAEQVVCPPVNAGGADHMVSRLTDIEASEEIGRLPR